jgi:hypothetical protein
VRVEAEVQRSVRVPDPPTDGDDVEPGRDQLRDVGMPKGMERHLRQLQDRDRLGPGRRQSIGRPKTAIGPREYRILGHGLRGIIQDVLRQQHLHVRRAATIEAGMATSAWPWSLALDRQPGFLEREL